MRSALLGFASLLATFLLGPAIAEGLSSVLPGALVAGAGVLIARSLVSAAANLQSEELPGERRCPPRTTS